MYPSRKAKQKGIDSLDYYRKDKKIEKSSVAKDCVICLEKAQVQGAISGCDHCFCFICIYEWSKRTNTCPLCKKKFRCITKKSLLPNGSPRKVFRIKDKEQSFQDQDDIQDDYDIAMGLLSASETSGDDENDSDFEITIVVDRIPSRRSRSRVPGTELYDNNGPMQATRSARTRNLESGLISEHQALSPHQYSSDSEFYSSDQEVDEKRRRTRRYSTSSRSTSRESKKSTTSTCSTSTVTSVSSAASYNPMPASDGWIDMSNKRKLPTNSRSRSQHTNGRNVPSARYRPTVSTRSQSDARGNSVNRHRLPRCAKTKALEQCSPNKSENQPNGVKSRSRSLRKRNSSADSESNSSEGSQDETLCAASRSRRHSQRTVNAKDSKKHAGRKSENQHNGVKSRSHSQRKRNTFADSESNSSDGSQDETLCAASTSSRSRRRHSHRIVDAKDTKKHTVKESENQRNGVKSRSRPRRKLNSSADSENNSSEGTRDEPIPTSSRNRRHTRRIVDATESKKDMKESENQRNKVKSRSRPRRKLNSSADSENNSSEGTRDETIPTSSRNKRHTRRIVDATESEEDAVKKRTSPSNVKGQRTKSSKSVVQKRCDIFAVSEASEPEEFNNESDIDFFVTSAKPLRRSAKARSLEQCTEKESSKRQRKCDIFIDAEDGISEGTQNGSMNSHSDIFSGTTSSKRGSSRSAKKERCTEEESKRSTKDEHKRTKSTKSHTTRKHDSSTDSESSLSGGFTNSRNGNSTGRQRLQRTCREQRNITKPKRLSRSAKAKALEQIEQTERDEVTNKKKTKKKRSTDCLGHSSSQSSSNDDEEDVDNPRENSNTKTKIKRSVNVIDESSNQSSSNEDNEDEYNTIARSSPILFESSILKCNESSPRHDNECGLTDSFDMKNENIRSSGGNEIESSGTIVFESMNNARVEEHESISICTEVSPKSEQMDNECSQIIPTVGESVKQRKRKRKIIESDSDDNYSTDDDIPLSNIRKKPQKSSDKYDDSRSASPKDRLKDKHHSSPKYANHMSKKTFQSEHEKENLVFDNIFDGSVSSNVVETSRVHTHSSKKLDRKKSSSSAASATITKPTLVKCSDTTNNRRAEEGSGKSRKDNVRHTRYKFTSLPRGFTNRYSPVTVKR